MRYVQEKNYFKFWCIIEFALKRRIKENTGFTSVLEPQNYRSGLLYALQVANRRYILPSIKQTQQSIFLGIWIIANEQTMSTNTLDILMHIICAEVLK